MFKSMKLNTFCICFRGLKLGPNPHLGVVSRSLPIDFNGHFIQPQLVLQFLVIKLFSSSLTIKTGFNAVGMQYVSITPSAMSFLKGYSYQKPLFWEKRQPRKAMLSASVPPLPPTGFVMLLMLS